MIDALAGLWFGVAAAVGAAAVEPATYLVLVEPGEGGAYRAAAEKMAAMHGGRVVEVSFGELGEVERVLGEERPWWVVFVMPPGRVDVELSRRILEMAVRVDDDPFVDFEYGFVTGRDGAAALGFVERIAARRDELLAGKGEKRRAGFFGTWEGAVLPPLKNLSAMEAMWLEATGAFVLMKSGEAEREAAARAALAEMSGKDALLFFSHGYPDEMVGCFTGEQLRAWGVDLGPAVLFNSACYNGAPGRWWEPTGRGFVEREAPAAGESAALAILDSGVTGAFLGVDPWHGPLTCQVFALAVDEGLTLGGAAKRMFDRLALEFVPGRIEFGPVAERKVLGEGVENRRSNGAGMIFYGDPKMGLDGGGGPAKLMTAQTAWAPEEPERIRVTIRSRPMIQGKGAAGPDAMVPMWRLANYYSVRTADVMKELAPEIYQVVPLPDGWDVEKTPRLRVARAKVGKDHMPMGEVEAVVEEWHDGVRRLHVRVPVAAPMMGTPWVERMMREGVEVELEGVGEGKGEGGTE